MTINDLDYQDVLLSTDVVGNPIKIPAGGSLSTAIDLKGFMLKGILAPAAWTAAALDLQVSFDGVSFFPYFDNIGAAQKTLVSSANLTGALGAWIGYTDLGGAGIPGIMLLPRFIKLRSGTDAAPVNQVADRLFTLCLAPHPWRVMV